MPGVFDPTNPTEVHDMEDGQEYHKALSAGWVPLKVVNPNTGEEYEMESVEDWKQAVDAGYMMPDAYSAKQQYNKTRATPAVAAGMGTASGLTLGAAPRIAAGIGAVVDTVKEIDNFQRPHLLDNYDKEYENIRTLDTTSEKEHPYLYGTGEFAGNLIGTLATGGAAGAAKSATTVPGLMKMGAIQGGVTSFNKTEDLSSLKGIGDAAVNTVIGAGLGGAGAGVVGEAGKLLGKAGKKVFGGIFSPTPTENAEIVKGTHLGERIQSNVDELQNWFSEKAKGWTTGPLTKQKIVDSMNEELETLSKGLRDKFGKVQVPEADMNNARQIATQRLQDLVNEQPTRELGQHVLEKGQQYIEHAFPQYGTNVTKLVPTTIDDLLIAKRQVGNRVGKYFNAASNANDVLDKEIEQNIYGSLDNIIDDIANRNGIPNVVETNKRMSALIYGRDKIAKDAHKGIDLSPGSVINRAGPGGVATAVGAWLGGPVGAATGFAGSELARTTPAKVILRKATDWLAESKVPTVVATRITLSLKDYLDKNKKPVQEDIENIINKYLPQQGAPK